jgi:hypothetical protein
MNSRIVNLSLSGSEDPLLRQLIEKVLGTGVIVIAAVSGNDQAGRCPATIEQRLESVNRQSALQRRPPLQSRKQTISGSWLHKK